MKIEQGDIILIHSHNASALLIQFGMNVKRWLNPIFWFKYLRGEEKLYDLIFNHVGMGRHNDNIQEAIDKGVKTQNINIAYEKKKNMIIRVYRYDWSDEQIKGIEVISNKLENKKYQFDNFGLWTLNILTLGTIWLGRTANRAFNKIYCTELNGAKIFYATAPNLSKSKIDDEVHYMFKNYWRTSPLKMQNFCEKYCVLINEYYI